MPKNIEMPRFAAFPALDTAMGVWTLAPRLARGAIDDCNLPDLLTRQYLGCAGSGSDQGRAPGPVTMKTNG